MHYHVATLLHTQAPRHWFLAGDLYQISEVFGLSN